MVSPPPPCCRLGANMWESTTSTYLQHPLHRLWSPLIKVIYFYKISTQQCKRISKQSCIIFVLCGRSSSAARGACSLVCADLSTVVDEMEVIVAWYESKWYFQYVSWFLSMITNLPGRQRSPKFFRYMFRKGVQSTKIWSNLIRNMSRDQNVPDCFENVTCAHPEMEFKQKLR